MSKSEKIRNLYDEGNSVAECASKVGVRYQFAYNVISKLCEKRGESVRRVNKVTKADQIRELFNQGNTVGSIAKQLNANYNHVHQVVSKYKKALNK